MIDCITLCSGGLDSAVLAYYTKACGLSQELLTFDYGQRNRPELYMATTIAHRLGVNSTVIGVDLDVVGTSALTNSGIAFSTEHLASPEHQSLYFPNRNIIFLSYAYSVAMAKQATLVAIGSEGGDEIFFPDNKPDTLQAYEDMQRLATRGFWAPNLWYPLVKLIKPQVVALGYELHVPFEVTWSCYDHQEKQCGVCWACQARKDAFVRAGVVDPTEYQ